jgi:hypothetical protein
MNSMSAQVEAALRLLLSKLASDSRSSSEISRLSGVSQPTVSRMRLSGRKRSRLSESFNRLCIFYGIPLVIQRTQASSDYNDLLRDAIIDAWDGTEAHGRALLMIVRGLKGLSTNIDD